jgi:6-phosphofructokinase
LEEGKGPGRERGRTALNYSVVHVSSIPPPTPGFHGPSVGVGTTRGKTVSPPNALYAQSGGVTAVINTTARGVIEAVRRRRARIGRLYAGRDGILGVLEERLIDTSRLTASDLAILGELPGGVFGSCRYKLRTPEERPELYARLLDVFAAHRIGYFFYNGGGDSQDTAQKVAAYAAARGYPLTVLGIPKTIDNDLPETDCAPGYGSVARYVAVSTWEAARDVASMASTSTRVFILEVMGRHAGWIAAAAGLVRRRAGDAPHLILFPERPFDEATFLERVRATVAASGYCVIVASEGVRDGAGRFLAESGGRDAFGHVQLGGVAPRLAALVQEKLGLKCHAAVADYLQRSARHLASRTDLELARAVGRDAVRYALAGRNAEMVTIERLSARPYRWRTGTVPLERVANRERHLPDGFISADGFGITAAARRHLAPFVVGDASPRTTDGLPPEVRLPLPPVRRRLQPFRAPR